jgi:hypothetical protein
MCILLTIIALLALGAIFASELIRATRVVIAYIKGDEVTVNRLTHTYSDCELIAFKKYDCSKELFAQYWKEVRDYNPDALPWDALDFCAWEYDILNNK